MARRTFLVSLLVLASPWLFEVEVEAQKLEGKFCRRSQILLGYFKFAYARTMTFFSLHSLHTGRSNKQDTAKSAQRYVWSSSELYHHCGMRRWRMERDL